MHWRSIELVIALAVGAWSIPALADEPAPATINPAVETPPVKPAKTLRVAAVQMRSSRDLAENVAKVKQHLADGARAGARVVVFPECALSGYFDAETMKALTDEQLADAQRQVALACRQHQVYAVIGTAHRENGKLYNSAVVIDPAGEVIERYHKIQLAESWPDGGDHLAVFTIDGVPASIIICHDERYPELVRLPVLAGARLVFCISHESGITSESKMEPYRAQIRARAVENTVYVVQANAPANTDTTGSHGQSRIIAPDGNLIDEASVFGEDTVLATLDMGRATGAMAEKSVTRGPFGDWWQQGVGKVRILGARPAEPAAKDAAGK